MDDINLLVAAVERGKEVDLSELNAGQQYLLRDKKLSNFDGLVRIPKTSLKIPALNPVELNARLNAINPRFSSNGCLNVKLNALPPSNIVAPRAVSTIGKLGQSRVKIHTTAKPDMSKYSLSLNSKSAIASRNTDDFTVTAGGLIINKSNLIRNANCSVSTSKKRQHSDTMLSPLNACLDLESNKKKKQSQDEKPLVSENEIEKLINQKSTHAEEEQCEWLENFSKRLDKLSKSEYISSKLNSIHSIQVKAYMCDLCHIILEYPRELCNKLKHPIRKVSAMKRFFECRVCMRKESTLGVQRLPEVHCVCGNYNWIACGKNGSGKIHTDASEKLITSDWDKIRYEAKRGEMDGSREV